METLKVVYHWATKPIPVPMASKPLPPSVQRRERWMTFTAFVYGLLLGSCIGVATELRKDNLRMTETALVRAHP